MLAYLMTASVPQCAFRAPTEPTLYSNLVTSQTGASAVVTQDGTVTKMITKTTKMIVVMVVFGGDDGFWW